MKKKKISSLKGQTILELLIAMAVIAVGLLSAVTLVYYNLKLVEQDIDEAVVVNMAREGVELAKSIRDSNWLASDQFDNGLHDGSDYTATPAWNGSSGSLFFDFEANNFSHGNTNVIQVTTSTAPAFFANNNPILPAYYTSSTEYQRLLTFHPICEDYTVLDSAAVCDPQLKIGIRVEAKIQWLRKGVAKAFTIYEDLYDWR
ncbi:MAG: prepilin-type N-terminal cleavage/methylation domain-containing protein [Patescibacteria group bacterium]